jgi:hypothetical protein
LLIEQQQQQQQQEQQQQQQHQEWDMNSGRTREADWKPPTSPQPNHKSQMLAAAAVRR